MHIDSTARRNRRPLVAVLAASGISLTGNTITALAVPWFVLQTTGSATQTGLTGFAAILPVVLSSFLGGPIVDRLGFKRASVVADLASAGSVAMIPVLYTLDLLAFPVLLALVFLGALLDAPGSTARYALTPDLAEQAGWTIEQSTSALQVVERGARLFGAPMAGLLVAFVGPATVLWLDAASFLISAGLVAVAVSGPAGQPHEATTGSFLAELETGLRFIAGDRLIRVLLLVLMVTNFLDMVWFAVVAPVFARDVYGSSVALGLLAGASGGGAVIGAILYGARGSRLPRVPVFVAGFVLAGSKTLLLAFFPPLAVAVTVAAVCGLGAGPLNPILHALPLERVPAALRGRILGAMRAASALTMPLGALVAGPLLDAFGLRPLMLLVGVCYVTVTAAMAFVPAVRTMDTTRSILPARA